MLKYILLFLIAITISGTSVSSYSLGIANSEIYEPCSMEDKQNDNLYFASALGLTGSLILCISSIILLIIIMSPEVLYYLAELAK